MRYHQGISVGNRHSGADSTLFFQVRDSGDFEIILVHDGDSGDSEIIFVHDGDSGDSKIILVNDGYSGVCEIFLVQDGDSGDSEIILVQDGDSGDSGRSGGAHRKHCPGDFLRDGGNVQVLSGENFLPARGDSVGLPLQQLCQLCPEGGEAGGGQAGS